MKLAEEVLKSHSLHKYIIETGFACATYGNHNDIIQMLLEIYYQTNGSSVTCLSIAMQQKNLELIKLWYRSSSEKDLCFDWRIITEDQSGDIFNFLDLKISGRIYNFYTCLAKSLRSGNSEQAQKMVAKYRPYTLMEKIKLYWHRIRRIGVYLKTCEACLWGNLTVLKMMREKGFFLHVPGDLALISAHFLGHLDIECYLHSQGCKLEKKTLFYNLAKACATSNIDLLKEKIDCLQFKGSYALEDICLKLMLLLSIKNDNISMIEFILSKCGFLSVGIMDIFEYAVDLQKVQIVFLFLKKFNSLAYFAVVHGSYLNNERFVKAVSPFLCQEHQQAAFLKVYQYGMIHQNFELITLGAKMLNLEC